VAGPSNSIQEQSGNLDVTGFGGALGSGPDTGTQIDIGGSGVTDSITLDGGANVLDDSATSTPGDHSLALTDADVSYAVSGNAGGNTVNLDDAGGTVTVKAGGDANQVVLAGSAANTVTFTKSSAYNIVVLAATGTNTVTAANSAGGNTISAYGTANTVTAGGSGNNIALNGDAANDVSTGASTAAAPNTVAVGSGYDGLYGYSSTVALGGSGNAVTGGDENFTISGGIGKNTVTLGDGNSTVFLDGTGNSVSVGGGLNSVIAEGSNAAVNIAGAGGLSLAAFVPDASDPVLLSNPTDFVVIDGTGDSVNATYENVIISGSGVTSLATVNLGGGDNAVTLGGRKNTVNVGDGANSISLSGNGNAVTVTDPAGAGTDTVTLGSGTGDSVNLDSAAGSVTGTGAGVTKVTQTGANGVTVSLGNGVGLVNLGDGTDAVTANGNGSSITLGAGSDMVSAGGANDVIAVNADGGAFSVNNITANGTGDSISVGSASSYGGSSTVTALATGASLSNGDTITVGANYAANKLSAGSYSLITFNNGGGFPNLVPTGAVVNTVTAGSGNTISFLDTAGYFGDSNTVTAGSGNSITFDDALGTLSPDTNTATVTSGSSVTFNSLSSSSDYFNVGAPGTGSAATTVSQTDGYSYGVAHGPNDTFLLAGVNSGSTLSALFGNETIKFWLGSSDSVSLSTAANNDTIVVQADTSAGTYSGDIHLTGFAPGDRLCLESLVGGVNGKALTSFAQVKANWTQYGGVTTIHLAGGGQIVLGTTVFTTSGAHASFVFNAT